METITLPPPFPDHTQLPESDGTFVKNFQEHPQSIILTDSIGAILQQIHPEGDYAIGQDSGIYWRETDPPEQGAEAPDWFYVGGVPPLLDGQIRRSYVLWREYIKPLIVLEFASGSGKEERDKTSLSESRKKGTRPGKFWVYEQIIGVPYYGIYEIQSGKLEVYHLFHGFYHQLEPNERGHYPIDFLPVELGLWRGNYQNQTLLWLRWWDKDGNLLLTGQEQAELEKVHTERERERAEQEHERAERERERADHLEKEKTNAEGSLIKAISRLQQLGLSAEQIASALNLSVELVQNSIIN
ncbi:MAG: Uma2 family endonuclease [Prochloron sp. SP5CPC1]|nr:Uma2 family endonuclease [Candidatus Paraprochloron terpiosi SP5CPC1]